jgi:hypothetical protein
MNLPVLRLAHTANGSQHRAGVRLTTQGLTCDLGIPCCVFITGGLGPPAQTLTRSGPTTRKASAHLDARIGLGMSCRGRVIAGNLCFVYQPNVQENRVKGGRNRSNAARSLRAMPERLRLVADVFVQALDEVHAGDLDHGRRLLWRH